MANLFHTEMVRMRTESQPPSKKEATTPQTSAKARKRSMLPKGCYFIHNSTFIQKCDFKHNKFVFQSLMMKTMKISEEKKTKERSPSEFIVVKDGGRNGLVDSHLINVSFLPRNGYAWLFLYSIIRHHTVDYSFETDYAVAPLPSTSSYIAKINQKWYIL